MNNKKFNKDNVFQHHYTFILAVDTEVQYSEVLSIVSNLPFNMSWNATKID